MAMEDILLILALNGSSHNKRHKFFELRIQKAKKKTKKERKRNKILSSNFIRNTLRFVAAEGTIEQYGKGGTKENIL